MFWSFVSFVSFLKSSFEYSIILPRTAIPNSFPPNSTLKVSFISSPTSFRTIKSWPGSLNSTSSPILFCFNVVFLVLHDVHNMFNVACTLISVIQSLFIYVLSPRV
uniref:Uncharacterized protein n=1 Tax=Cacopsylla melanoneura TaxID=428564 RepID=A0A8D8T4M1_9HEMI